MVGSCDQSLPQRRSPHPKSCERQFAAKVELVIVQRGRSGEALSMCLARLVESIAKCHLGQEKVSP